MDTWIVMRQLLVAMDVVMRAWADELGLTWNELMTMLLLEQRGTMACVDLATRSGRRRQHTQRSLKDLQRRGIVEPVRHARNGRVAAWALTAHGRDYLSLVHTRMHAWEGHLQSTTWFELMLETIRRGVEVLINRPFGGAWHEGMTIPEVLRLSPPLDQEVLVALHEKERQAIREAGPPPQPVVVEVKSEGDRKGSDGVTIFDSGEAARLPEGEESRKRVAHHFWALFQEPQPEPIESKMVTPSDPLAPRSPLASRLVK